MKPIENGRFHHFSLKEGLLSQESITITLGPKKLIILPHLMPTSLYIESRPAHTTYRYVLAGKELESFGNINLTQLGLSKQGFADPQAFERLKEAVENGTYWKIMRSYLGQRWDERLCSNVPSKEKIQAFLLPQFAYTLDLHKLSGWAALFVENRTIGKVYPEFKLA